jgi:hypothetical protein
MGYESVALTHLRADIMKETQHHRHFGSVRPAQASIQCSTALKQQVSHQLDRLCDKFDSLQLGDPRATQFVGYIARLNVEFQAAN